MLIDCMAAVWSRHAKLPPRPTSKSIGEGPERRYEYAKQRGWKHQLARNLVRRAEKVVSPICRRWTRVLRSEVEHVPEDLRPLTWAVGCVWARYRERYWSKGRSLLAVIGVGVLFAFLDIPVGCFMAARPMPHWYGTFASAHKHFGLELWLTLMRLPSALIGAPCGLLSGQFADRRTMTWLPFLSLAVWQLYGLGDEIRSSTAIYPFSFTSLWEADSLFPSSSIIGIVLPACALMIGFRLIQMRMRGLP